MTSWEYGDGLSVDYELGQHVGVLCWSIKKQKASPSDLKSRMLCADRHFVLRIILCLIDVRSPATCDYGM